MPVDPYSLMQEALREAQLGLSEGEVPVGAVLATSTGKIIAQDHNRPISLIDPTAHAEILVMRKAGQALDNYRLTGTILVTTVEPCLMCMGADLHARIGTLAFGTKDPKAGAAGSLYHLGTDGRLNHRIEIISGIMGSECQILMQEFFKARR